jgi:oxygen-independent coproporphyrinogen-3 oxidase
MMGMRLRAGIQRNRLLEETRQTIETAYDRARLARLIAGGFLVLDDEGLRATATGSQRLNAVIGELIA